MSETIPIGGTRGRAQRAFTLLELVVTIAVLAVIFGLAIPSFSSFTAAQRVRSASFDLNASLIQVRSEATKRNVDVVLQQAAGGWQSGWTVTTAGGVVVSNHDALSNISITPVPYQASITIRGNGRQPAGAVAVKFTFAPSPAASGVSSRCLLVDTSGKATTAC